MDEAAMVVLAECRDQARRDIHAGASVTAMLRPTPPADSVTRPAFDSPVTSPSSGRPSMSDWRR